MARSSSSSLSPPPSPPPPAAATTTPTTRLRARKSSTDARVTLYSLPSTTASASESPKPAATPRKRKAAASKAEGNDGKGKGKARAVKEGTPMKQKPIQKELAVAHPAPENWEEVYELIQRMRAEAGPAPVDTLGCERVPTGELSERTKRFQILVSLMLSSQTKDPVTSEAVDNLRRVLPGGLTLESILAASEKTIQEAICKVGFWRRKSEYLKKAAEKLRDDFGGDLPKDIDELCSLPGVGPKMGYLALQAGWNINAGIGVDVHVHRITNRLGWHEKATTQPEQTRLNLQSWLPKPLHREINKVLVGFGQLICLPVGPKCDECLLSAQGLCPSARVVSPKKRRKVGEKGGVEGKEKEKEKVGEALVGVEVVVEGEAVKKEAEEEDVSGLGEAVEGLLEQVKDEGKRLDW